MKNNALKYLAVASVFICIAVGAIVLQGKSYALVSFIAVILACIPFIIRFEKGKTSTRVLVLMAVMVAISVAGRFLFAPIPFFKPVTSIVIISSMYLGAEAGFLIGGLSALISNFYFGQGPWTPFQMFAWGLIGFIAGLMSNPLKRSRIVLCIYGFVAGFAYSLILDSWSTLWVEGYFSLDRFIAFTITAIPVTLCYAVSNVVFLLIIGKPMGQTLERTVKKYGLTKESK